MNTEPTTWRTYEEVAVFLLNEFAEILGIDRVEGKQSLSGNSGTEWEIDGKAILMEDEGILVLECRRTTTSRQSQEKMAALAYRIHDLKASGGIIVSPFDLQKGAKKVAHAEGIERVVLRPDSSSIDYFIEFLERNYAAIGTSDSIHFSESFILEKTSEDGTTETLRG